MDIAEATPVLPVADVSRSVRWYRDVFGLDADTFFDSEPFVFAIVHNERTRIMLKHIDGYRRDPRLESWDLHLTLSGGRIREVYAHLRNGVPIHRRLERMPYGDVEFEVLDPDGHVVCVSELLKDASDIPDARE